jgi:outer membrane receptor protein involved in Fe transport
VIRDANNQISRVEALFINLANQRVRGLDLELNYSGVNVGGGTLSWRLLGSHLYENSVLTPGSPRDDRAGDVGSAPPAGGLPKDKFTTSLRYARGPISIFLQERYVGGGVNDHLKVESTTRFAPPSTIVTIDDNTVSSVMYTDLSFSFTGGKSGATPWEAFLTVNNLTNAEPPATYQVVGRAGVAGPNTYLYDTLGRRFTAGVRVNF